MSTLSRLIWLSGEKIWPYCNYLEWIEASLAHYQKIVVALQETIRLMQEIDEVIEEHGDWPGAFVTK